MTAAFEGMAGLLPEPMLLVSGDGAVVAANAAAGRLIGAKAGVLPGRALADLGWPGADTADYLALCARSRSFVLGAATLRHADGSTLRLRCEGLCLEPRSEDAPALLLLRLSLREQAASRFIELTRTITRLNAEIRQRQRAQEDADRHRELLEVTLTSIGDAVIATDARSVVTFMNPVAERLTGWSRTEAEGRSIDGVFTILDEQTRQRLENPVEKVLALGHVVGLANHTILVSRDGVERPIDDSGAPIVDREGGLRGAVLVFRDVTQRRAAEREQAEARQSAEAANRAKDEFIATLSHELRTPLNAILGWARMLRHPGTPPSRWEHGLSVVERNAEMQARLVEDLLDISRITSGQLRLQESTVRIAQIIRAAADAVRPAAENKRLALAVSADGDATVRGDAGRLQQVVWNLLNNAVKFTPGGGRVAVDASAAAGHVTIAVHDTGQGFPASFKPYLFDAFRQADASFTRAHGGLGLGLTIARRLVEAHGGTIHAESPGPDRGATFTVVLPAAGGPPG